MTWVAWRVQRLQYLVAVGVVLAVELWLTLSGSYVHSSWAQSSSPGDIIVMSALPGLLGLALGASLVADEFHRGTNRLAWSQTISRSRWLLIKLTVGGAVVSLLAGLLVPLMGWWSGASNSGLDIQPKLFDITGVVVVAYTIFAFMLGALLGGLIPKPGWAFAAGVPLFAFFRLLMSGVRSSLVAPLSLTAPFQGPQPRGWILHYGYLPLRRTSPTLGRSWTDLPHGVTTCFSRVSSASGEAHCVLVAHLHWVWQYQPESHYWPLQWRETAIFLGLSVVCFVATLRIVRRQEA
jgi:ABC-type transport system involved in multi-copper enzyme maturation permease subunit